MKNGFNIKKLILVISSILIGQVSQAMFSYTTPAFEEYLKRATGTRQEKEEVERMKDEVLQYKDALDVANSRIREAKEQRKENLRTIDSQREAINLLKQKLQEAKALEMYLRKQLVIAQEKAKDIELTRDGIVVREEPVYVESTIVSVKESTLAK